MAESGIVEQIKKLIKLQEGDTGIYSLRKELEEKPLILRDLEQQFEAKKARLKQLEADYRKIQLERSALEGDLLQKEQAIHKSEAQLLQIKTNKEYTAKIGEIEGLKADNSVIEEKILQSYDQADSVKAVMEDERKAVAAQEAGFLKQKQEIESQIKVLEQQIQELSVGRAQLLEGIDRELLIRYERILNSRDGLAVVPVQGASCGGCFMNVPQQTINEIRKHKDAVFCEICTRILYLEDDLNREAS